MTTTKKAARTHHAVDPTLVAQAAGLASPLPAETAPSPPSTFDPAAKTSLGRSLNPRRVQIELAPQIAAELAKNRAQYTQQFGEAAPDPGSIGDALLLAHGWSAKVRAAESWHAYVRYQEQLAWQHATSLTDALKVPFVALRQRNADIATQYPSLSKVFDLPKAAAAKAVNTRKANKKKEVDDATSTTTTSSAPEASNATPEAAKPA